MRSSLQEATSKHCLKDSIKTKSRMNKRKFWIQEVGSFSITTETPNRPVQ